MRRWFLALFATAGMTLAAAPAQAESWGDKWDRFWHGVHVDWHRNNAWPEPFLSADRAAQRARHVHVTPARLGRRRDESRGG